MKNTTLGKVSREKEDGMKEYKMERRVPWRLEKRDGKETEIVIWRGKIISHLGDSM